MSAERRRLTLAFLLSLLLHALLLSLTFGGEEFGLPGFGFPWRQRRIEVPDLRVALVPARVNAAEAPAAPVKELPPQASIGRTVAVGPAPTPTPKPEVIALEQPDESTWVVSRPPPVPAAGVVDVPGDSIPEAAMPAPPDADDMTEMRAEPDARERAVEAAKLDAREREAQRQAEQLEAARAEAERQEAARLAAAKLEAQRQETGRQETARQEAVRQEAARQEAARQEAARQEAARQEAARQEAARQEAARQEAARQETARQEAARVEAARLQAEQEEDARREARRRAMGRQLEEEAARRAAAANAARAPSALPLSSSTARRVRLWGRADPNVELVQYAEAWARKIQFNTPVDMVREMAKRPHANPMVTVAIRSDGTVESVTFVVSSGVAEVDEAIRRIVQSHAPYQAFPPGLARDFDVVEVRRTWHFDTAVRLY